LAVGGVSTPWAEPGRGVFSISVAAELTGLHPQTLRLYEQEGLVLPARSSGGTRRYSTQDFERLHQIMALTSEGVNLAGIRRIFELQEQTRLLQAEIDQLAAAASTPGARVATRRTNQARIPEHSLASARGEEDQQNA
jgi:MerR family transcriptional regulator, heat shock protein HspR